MKKHYISRSEVADALDVSHQTVANWCSRRVHIPPRHLQALADYLGSRGVARTDLADLVQDELRSQGLVLSDFVVGSRTTHKEADLRGGRLVLVIAWTLDRSFLYSHTARACVQTIEHLGFRCLLMDCSRQHHLKRFYAKMALALDCAGVLFVGAPGELPEPEEELRALSDPLVRAGRAVGFVGGWERAENLPNGVFGVGWDASRMFQMLVDLLIERGHRRIGAVLPYVPLHARYDLLTKALNARGLDLPQDWIAWQYEGRAALGDLRRVVSLSTAVVATTTGLEPVAAACYDLNLRWPEDLSVVTLAVRDATPRYGPRPFTYVALPALEMARGASQLLSARFAEEEDLPRSGPFLVMGQEDVALEHVEDGSVGPPGAREKGSRPLGKVKKSRLS